jgi:uncharacterized phage protein gp47/JayE
VDLPSRQDLFAVGRRFIKAEKLVNPNVRINPALIDVRGSNLNLELNTSAVMGEAIVAAWAKCVRGLFIDTARDEQLDRVIYDRFGITRKPANAATAGLALVRPTFAGGGGTVAAGSRITTANGAIFAVATDIVFGATDLTKTGDGVAQLVGPTQNVPAGTLTRFLDQPFDTTITVTNPDDAAGGTERERDPQFRGRARTFFLTLRRGILGAIQYAATQVPGVSVATAFEIVNPGTALPAGAVQLVIADDNGAASGLMIQAVIDKMLEFRAAGIPVYVTGGLVTFVPVTYLLSFQANIDTVSASEEVRAVAVAISQFKAPGQTLYQQDLMAAAKSVPGVIVTDKALVAPVGDVVPTSNTQILRVRAQDVNFV